MSFIEYTSYRKYTKIYKYLLIYINKLHIIGDLRILSDLYFNINNENKSDDNYEDANKVWNLFKCEKFRDCHEIYLKVDAILLVDVF